MYLFLIGEEQVDAAAGAAAVAAVAIATGGLLCVNGRCVRFTQPFFVLENFRGVCLRKKGRIKQVRGRARERERALERERQKERGRERE